MAGTEGSAAGFTALFVRRPILALVLNSLIVIAGLAAVLDRSSSQARAPATTFVTSSSYLPPMMYCSTRRCAS